MKYTSKSILSDLLLVDFLSSSKPRISLFSPSKLSDDNSVHRKSKVLVFLLCVFLNLNAMAVEYKRCMRPLVLITNVLLYFLKHRFHSQLPKH